MRAAATHFEQVPKAVIEKILEQQDPPAENEPLSVEAGKKWAGGETQNKMKTRNSKP
jgi:hypothetical protein